jgi:hypothetical protein
MDLRTSMAPSAYADWVHCATLAREVGSREDDGQRRRANGQELPVLTDIQISAGRRPACPSRQPRSPKEPDSIPSEFSSSILQGATKRRGRLVYRQEPTHASYRVAALSDGGTVRLFKISLTITGARGDQPTTSADTGLLTRSCPLLTPELLSIRPSNRSAASSGTRARRRSASSGSRMPRETTSASSPA